jgi:hypothetical protein
MLSLPPTHALEGLIEGNAVPITLCRQQNALRLHSMDSVLTHQLHCPSNHGSSYLYPLAHHHSRTKGPLAACLLQQPLHAPSVQREDAAAALVGSQADLQ